MENAGEVVRVFALKKIAKIFKVPVESLNREACFGKELKATSKPRLFKRSEYDQIEGDILDVSDRRTYKAISSGNLTIHTVGDYCDHMLRCYQTKPNDVIAVLGINAIE